MLFFMKRAFTHVPKSGFKKPVTLWCQLEDMFQLKDTPTKVYAIGAELFLSKVPLEVLQNWVLIQLKDMPHIFENVHLTGSNKRTVSNIWGVTIESILNFVALLGAPLIKTI